VSPRWGDSARRAQSLPPGEGFVSLKNNLSSNFFAFSTYLAAVCGTIPIKVPNPHLRVEKNIEKSVFLR
jgi:hypothetical protein